MLFDDLPESLSPKLAWLRKHGLVTEFFSEALEMDEDEFGNDVFPWTCHVIKTDGSTYSPREIGGGRTEEEAILNYCQKAGIKHYSLE